MKKTNIVIGAVILAVIIFGFIIFNKSSDTGLAKNDLVLTGKTKEITMKAFQFGFDPNIIEVNQGDRIIIKVMSTDVPHGIGIPSYGINKYLAPGKEVTVDFIADKKGVFIFYCSVACGSGHGSMRGELIVN